jgi:hypothetical protein
MGLVEWLKLQALSSNSSTVEKKNNNREGRTKTLHSQMTYLRIKKT